MPAGDDARSRVGRCQPATASSGVRPSAAENWSTTWPSASVAAGATVSEVRVPAFDRQAEYFKGGGFAGDTFPFSRDPALQVGRETPFVGLLEPQISPIVACHLVAA